MTELRRSPPMLDLPASAQAALVAGARELEPVRGLTHGFYKYPARFSPSFVRAAIQTFTQPGDLVLDNHVGGGTTLVEAPRARARRHRHRYQHARRIRRNRKNHRVQ
jgi:DNA methylase